MPRGAEGVGVVGSWSGAGFELAFLSVLLMAVLGVLFAALFAVSLSLSLSVFVGAGLVGLRSAIRLERLRGGGRIHRQLALACGNVIW